jgi:hypothetical protein
MKEKTLEQWCKNKGYPGVTKECILSANNQDDSKLQKKVKRHMIEGIVRK